MVKSNDLLKHHLKIISKDGITSTVLLDGKEIECKNFKVRHKAMGAITAKVEFYCLGGVDIETQMKKNRISIIQFLSVSCRKLCMNLRKDIDVVRLKNNRKNK